MKWPSYLVYTLSFAGLGCVSFGAYVYLGSTRALPLIAVPPVVNLGTVAEGDLATGNLLVKNVTSGNLKVAEVLTSCGCTTTSSLDVIRPGRSAPLTISFDSHNRPGPIDKIVRITPVGFEDRPLEVRVTGLVKETLVADPPGFSLGSLSANQRVPIKARVTRTDGSPLTVGTITCLHASHWKQERVDPKTVILTGVFDSPTMPGDYRDEIQIRDRSIKVHPLAVSLAYSIPALLTAVPSEINLGVISPNVETTGSFSITGPDAGTVKVISCPPNMTVKANERSDKQITFTFMYRTGPQSKQYITGSIVLASASRIEPRIAIPVYLATS